MATMEQLENALRKADAAGNQADAKALADAIRAMRAQQPAQPERPKQSYASGLLDSITQGAAFGFGDELTAGEAAILGKTPDGKMFDYSKPFGERYSTALDAERGQQDVFSAEHPVASTVAEVGGAVATGVGALGATGAGKYLASKAAPSLLGRTAQGAALGVGAGATEGAISGFGRGEGDNRVRSAGTGAMFGAGLGGVAGAGAPVVAEGVGNVAKWLLSRSANRNAAAEGLSPEATRVLAESLRGDDLTAGLRNIRSAGADAMPVDAGPTMRGLLDTAIQGSGAGGRIAREAVETRASNTGREVSRALDETLGDSASTVGPRAMQATERGIREGTASARSGAYDAAYNSAIDYSGQAGRRIEGMLGRVPGNVIAKANQLMQVEGVGSKQIMAQIADDGSVVFTRMPDVRQLDYITRALNEVAQTNDGAGMLGGQTPIGRAFSNLSRDLRSAVREAAPEYGKALDVAADAISQRNALKLGRSLLSARTTREDIADAVRGMSQAELKALRFGVRNQIDDAMANVSRTVMDGNTDAREAIKAVRDLSSRANREKLRMILPDADQLFEKIDAATQALELRAGVADNSKTYARQAMDRKTRDLTDGGTRGALERGEPVNATKRVVQAITGRTPEADLARREGVYADIARALTQPRGADAERILRTIDTFNRQQPINEEIARYLASRAGGAAALGGYQLGQQSLGR